MTGQFAFYSLHDLSEMLKRYEADKNRELWQRRYDYHLATECKALGCGNEQA